MFTGVTASSAAFADSDEYYDELENHLEDFCYMNENERRDFFSNYPDMAEYDEKLAVICEIENEDERINSIYDFIDAIIPETRDADDFDNEFDDIDDSYDDYDTDYIKDDKHYNLDDRLEDFCEMTLEEKRKFFENHPRLEQFSDRLANICDLSGDERENAIDNFIRDHFPEEKDHDDYRTDIREMADRYCEMSDEDKRAFIEEHDKAAEHIEKLNEYCSLDEDARKDFIKDHMKDKMTDKMTDKKPHMNYDKLCDMAASDRALEITDVAKLDRLSEWCEMTPEEREDFKQDHKGDMKDKDRMKDRDMREMVDRYCEMSDEDKLAFIAEHDKTAEHIEKLNDYCSLDEDERDDFAKDFMKDKMQNFDGMSDVAKDRMSDVAKDRMMDKDSVKMKMANSDFSPKLRAMIMENRDITDERMDEIKMKFKEKHGDLTDEKRSELKMKFKDYMKKVRVNLTDEQKSDIHDRIAEMKAFKADLRERASDMTDEEKQELRAEFIEKAKDMQLAWISPRTQMTAGLDAADVECREGFSLVMKASNGVAMCLYADTALKMIDRGIVVPAN